jgi:hypothetical protein
VKISLGKTARVYAITIPRDIWYVRAAMAIGGFFLWLIRSDFRSYLHNPEDIQRLVEAAGFSLQYEDKTLLWLTQVYRR